MKLVTMGSLAVGLVVWFLPAMSTALGKPPSGTKPFLVFDGTLYSNKPDLSMYGIRPIKVVYPQELEPDEWFKEPGRLPDVGSVQAVAREANLKGQVAVLDIEHWSLKGSPDSVRDNLTKFETVLEWFKEAAPDLSVGYYERPPISDYWSAIQDTGSEKRKSWQDKNDRIRSLANVVDVLFPSLYTFYEDQTGWEKNAIAYIEEARRYRTGKPVYVFLWPQYHDSNTKLVGQYLPGDYWRLQLETAKEYADGIVIWGGWGGNPGPAQWDENAQWWKITKDFMTKISQSGLSAPTSLRLLIAR